MIASTTQDHIPLTVTGFQVQKEDRTSSIFETDPILLDDDDLNEENEMVSIYERSFPVGSIFSFPVQATPPSLDLNDGCSNESEENFDSFKVPATFKVPECTRLTIDSISIDPASSGTSSSLSLYLSTDSNPDYLCLCPNITNQCNSRNGLGLSVIGPAIVQMALVSHIVESREMSIDSESDLSHYVHPLACVNVFGRVGIVDEHVANIVSQSKLAVQELVNDEVDEYGAKQTKEEQIPTERQKDMVTKKRKLISSTERIEPHNKVSNEDNTSLIEHSSIQPIQLSKKQRKKQAKQKAKELSEVIAKEKGFSEVPLKKSATAMKLRKRSLTKPRSIKGGIRIQDILHGTGSTVKAGRIVGINYVGTFPENEKVFDKNMSKNNPLQFRVGTGEVIKGLERGMEGMKVGGERIIIVPPSLGYGKKQTGNIPGDSTLQFTVNLLSVGNNK